MLFQSDDSPLSRASSSASGHLPSPGLPAVKKSRLSTEPSGGEGYASGGSPPGSNGNSASYNMYMYQTWMAAVAKGQQQGGAPGGGNGAVHPAAAQWMSNMAQAMKVSFNVHVLFWKMSNF